MTHDAIKELVADLSNDRAGWVVRRDAADALGVIAEQALATLQAHRTDADRDIKTAVLKALKRTGLARGAIEDPASALAAQPDYRFEELIAGLAYKDKRKVTMLNPGCRVELAIDSERKQAVFVVPFEDPEGADMIRIYTQCGRATDQAVAWAMRKNAQLLDSAFAVLKDPEGDALILISNIERIFATPPRVKGAVKEIARYGDYLEKKLNSADRH